MIKPPLSTLLCALEPVVRPVMLRHYSPDCCIATTRALRDVFKHFGYDAYPVAVSVAIVNARMARILKEHIHIPVDYCERLAFFEREDAWGLGIGIGDPLPGYGPAHGFDGHLVLRVMQTLVDASLQQADRPQKGISLGSLIAYEPGREFFRDHINRPESRVIVNGCELTYRCTFDASYRQSPDWNAREELIVMLRKTIVDKTVARLNDLSGVHIGTAPCAAPVAA